MGLGLHESTMVHNERILMVIDRIGGSDGGRVARERLLAAHELIGWGGGLVLDVGIGGELILERGDGIS